MEGGGNSRFWFDKLKKGLEPFYHYLEKVKNIKQKYFNTGLIPTHGDLVPQNILVSDKDIRLIDWECAGLNDP
ncbi:MAG: phosphotransferase [Campylobacter sp.]|uniref:phosphotransferase n=1 Tax=Campylobacter sp. TaxID=205 RepID=UPI002AA8E962|nr:phosphotransferase [Campylobacter sp.]MCI7246966.1 phosphotransferase [Campylobacter sp.]